MNIMGKLLEISLECYKKFKGYRKEFFDFFLEYIEPEKQKSKHHLQIENIKISIQQKKNFLN